MTPDKCQNCGLTCTYAAVRITNTVRGIRVTVTLCPRCYEAQHPSKEPAKH